MLEIDFNQCLKTDLTLEEGILLTIIVTYNKDSKLLSSYENLLQRTSRSIEDLVTNLENKDYIKIDEDSNIILLSKVFKQFVPPTTVNFKEFFAVYPVKTPNGRVLRTVETDTDFFKKMQKKYCSKIKKKHVHDAIIETVKKYLARVPQKDLEYLQAMESFINQNGWEKMHTYLQTNSGTTSNTGSITQME